jgi:predicted RNA binding protein YcfA (HicA-like mRNA interferase family)
MSAVFLFVKKGSHRVYQRPGLSRPIILPCHTKEVPVYIIKNTLRNIALDVERFWDIMERL